MIHEEATCACLGHGVPSALVVDIGASRTSVVCIDEVRSRRFLITISAIFTRDLGDAPQGQPMPGCRHQLSYGGDDLDRMLLWILRRQARRDHAEITRRSRGDRAEIVTRS